MAAEYRRPRSGRAPAVAKDRDRAFARHRERIASRHSVKTAEALVRMVDEFGFCFAFTGESAYPIPAAFDHLDTRSDGRKWEWMWGWKDELAEKKRLYYGKLLVKKPTFVSMKMLPIFYATFGRGGDDHAARPSSRPFGCRHRVSGHEALRLERGPPRARGTTTRDEERARPRGRPARSSDARIGRPLGHPSAPFVDL